MTSSSKKRHLLVISDCVILQMDDTHSHWFKDYNANSPNQEVFNLPREINELINQAVK